MIMKDIIVVSLCLLTKFVKFGEGNIPQIPGFKFVVEVCCRGLQEGLWGVGTIVFS